jgi:hypothetical protein
MKRIQRTKQELERSKRIRLSVAAFAYEFTGEITLTDQEYERLAYSIDREVATWTDQTDKRQVKHSKKCDEFFKESFQPYTGQWIWQHPGLKGIEAIYRRVHANS